jgi:thioredoxin-like negative regulator of GroEL
MMKKTQNASTLDQGSRPALVGFSAEWRAPFPAFVSVLGRVAGERNLRIAEVNVEKERQLAGRECWLGARR